MNIYKDYLNTISAAMHTNLKSHAISGVDESIQKGYSFQDLKNQIPEKKLLPSLAELASILGVNPDFNQKLGLHPDFADLKNSDLMCKHYIISMFIDIKGSTNLFKRYDPEIVSIITNSIQKAAIHTCLIFEGYIHRLQGDGLFVYFGGRNIDKTTATLKALQCSSVITYFVDVELRKLFLADKIEPIFTRIGIDLGHENDVVWSMAGIGEISEVTTCSLHTSLASKMQSHAKSNGIVVGDNIINQLQPYRDFFDTVCNRTNNPDDRYIFRITEKNFNYTQYDFSWYKFLQKQDFIATDLQENLQLKSNSKENNSSKNLGLIASQNKPYFKF